MARTIDSDRKHLTARAGRGRRPPRHVVRRDLPELPDLQRRRLRRDQGPRHQGGRDHPAGPRRADPVRRRRRPRAWSATPATGGVKVVEVGRRRRGATCSSTTPTPRPDHRVRDLAAHRRGLPPPGPDRDLPPGRALDVRRPGARPDRRPPSGGARATRRRGSARYPGGDTWTSPERPDRRGHDATAYGDACGRRGLGYGVAAYGLWGLLPALLAAARARRRAGDPRPPGAVVAGHGAGRGARAPPRRGRRGDLRRPTHRGCCCSPRPWSSASTGAATSGASTTAGSWRPRWATSSTRWSPC